MKQFIQSRIKVFAAGLLLFMTSCYTTVVTTPGPPGPPGDAFFSVSYDTRPPYSYWDNNPNVPYNPPLNVPTWTAPGIYNFEYFINSQQYWYGTYEIWINAGGPGGPRGEPGFPGADNFFTLVCDPHGFYAYVDGFAKNGNPNEPIVIEREDSGMNMRLTMQLTSVDERPAQPPKYFNPSGEKLREAKDS